MFIIKKLLGPFIIPPGAFVSLAFLIAALKFRKDRKQAALWAVFGLLMWAAGTRPVGNLALSGLEYSYLPPSAPKADAVVVLGAGIREGVPAPFGCAPLSSTALERAVEAALVYKKHALPLVVTGGAAFSDKAESGVIKDYLVRLGVPAGKIITEERARDTRENALFAKKLCEEKGFKRVILLTSAYHMRRAVWSFERAGFREITPWPSGYMSSVKCRYYWVDFLPGSCDMLRKAAQERVALLFYRLTM